MERQLLLTLKHAARVRTFVFDPAAASVVWLTPDEAGGECGAWACLERAGEDVVVRPIGETQMSISATGEPVGQVTLREGPTMLTLRSPSQDLPAGLYARPIDDGMARFETYEFREGCTIGVGRGRDNGLRYESRYVSTHHARFGLENGCLVVRDLQSGNGTLVNGSTIPPLQPRELKPGDIVQVLDLTIMVGGGLLCMNHPQGMFVEDCDDIRPYVPDAVPDGDAATCAVRPHFYPAPRLSRSVAPLALRVDAPPTREEEEAQPVLMQIGPSFLMGVSSVFMGASAISGIAEGGSLLSSLPSLSMTVALLGGTIVWPIVSRAYERRMREVEEMRCGRRYASYLDGIENRLLEAAVEEADILAENRLPVKELIRWARESSPRLMSHAQSHADFMELRVGIGDAMVNAEVSWPERSFSTVDDMLWERVEALEGNPPLMHDVPLACNLVDQPIVGIVGDRGVAWEFVRGLLVQVCARYSYHEVKVVVVADESERFEWEFLVSLGHLYEGEGDQRLNALTPEGIARIDRMLEPELERRFSSTPHSNNGSSGVHYVVVCAHNLLTKRSRVIDRLLRCESSMGFSLVYVAERLADLPRECGYLVDLDLRVVDEWGIAREGDTGPGTGIGRSACMFARSDVSATMCEFDPDILVTREDARDFALSLGTLKLGSSREVSSLPESVGFLELFRVGNAAHLNVGQRWAASDPARTLSTPIGIDAQGQSLLLDLHEKAHGPHGLVAGTTGSGKSEFIISYILSLCVEYRPDEVSFVLIDYKGGGLAGAFENEQMRLPHLAGTITNLDGGEVRRALVSIRSELRRRQRLFSLACEASGEATMDIHRYLTLCRQGVVKKRLPHLIVVADEFAELKEQEPEFMDELISAARIGRSLGMHLILATQKPTGVVNDQIWANSRFKVALKVSDAADSKEMIRRDDAAHLSRPGAFYLLVGYDELFVGGQAAYAGMSYEPKDLFEPRRDDAVELLNAEGEPVARLRPPKKSVGVNTDELHVVLDQIATAACAQGIVANRLWLDPLPERITIEEARRRGGAMSHDGLVCVVGLLDDPERQEQRRLDIDLKREGNVLLYGAPDTGTDELMRAMLVSMADAYGQDDVWIYGWDGGSGVLDVLESLPHVGGVASVGDEERTRNLLRMVEEEMTRRKRSPQVGAGERRPSIVLAISNLPSLIDADSDFEDLLIALTRDGSRQGIHLVATAGNSHSVPMRLQSNFGGTLLLWLRDESDYALLTGGTVDVRPPHKDRRGIVREGKRVLEFLGVSVSEGVEEERAEIEHRAGGSDQSRPFGPRPIPMLPRRVTAASFGSLGAGACVPVGYSKERVEPIVVDLADSFSLLVVGNERKALVSYFRGCYESLAQGNAAHWVLDLDEALGLPKGERVIRNPEAAHELVERRSGRAADVEVVLVTNIVHTLERLDSEDARALMTWIVQGPDEGAAAFVLGAEAWQMAARFEDWVRVVTSRGVGLWVGDGFADQTVFRYSRLLPAYRRPGGTTDGFMVRGAQVEGVRVIEPGEGGDS